MTMILDEGRKVFTDAAAVVVIFFGAGVKIESYRASSYNSPKTMTVIGRYHSQ